MLFWASAVEKVLAVDYRVGTRRKLAHERKYGGEHSAKRAWLVATALSPSGRTCVAESESIQAGTCQAEDTYYN